ncbi:MAG TPA: aminodeoxychorismate/anthranilate synthase component II [Planktothrix sp.]|jgi:anthranilate synthase/aminodeoxychorismate synthase-like glutamine amidotransferase
MKVVIIDNYDSFTFNLYQMLQPLADEPVEVFRNDRLSFDDVARLRADRIVLSPGPGHPANDSDFGVCKEIIVRRNELGCPVLGVCLGHQGIVQHLGGSVVGAPEIVHGKSSLIEIKAETPLFAGLTDSFEAMRYHSLVASEQGFPADLQVVARDANRALVMAIQHKKDRLYGVQFHPESIGTPCGAKILENFVSKC